jgi:purine-binding chemotaxis protein CheW
MNRSTPLVQFHLGGQCYAIPLEKVVRIVRAVEVTPLPHAPAAVMGVVDVEGRIFPVFNVRHRVGLPEKDIEPTDQFLLARTLRRAVALVIDEANGVLELPPERMFEASQIAPGLEYIRGAGILEDGIVLIHDLDRFLSLEEEAALDAALQKEASHAG